MNDGAVRRPQWQRLVGEFFAPLLGGRRESWGEANYTVMTSILEPAAWGPRLRAARDYADFERRYLLDWLAAMCAIVGVAMPGDEEALALANQANKWVRPQVDAGYPGAVDAIRALHTAGYQLCTASGEPSEDLHDYLVGMGVRQCFARLYGPDLIETFKNGPEFYARIFADAGISPADALVVDDSAAAIGWALEVGARAVLVGKNGDPPTRVPQIGSLRELPVILSSLM